MQEGQNETWNHAQEARGHVNAVIDELAQLCGTLLLDYPEFSDGGFSYAFTIPIQEMREELRCAMSHLTDIMVEHKTEQPEEEERKSGKPFTSEDSSANSSLPAPPAGEWKSDRRDLEDQS